MAEERAASGLRYPVAATAPNPVGELGRMGWGPARGAQLPASLPPAAPALPLRPQS